MPDPTPTPTPEPTPTPTPTPEPTPNPSVKIDHPTPEPTPNPAAAEFAKAIPDAYKDKPYMKEVTSFEKLFADFDGAQTLIGQRQQDPLAIPGLDATPEQIQAYAEKVRPESVDAYQFPETEYSKKFGRDEGFQGEMKELFHKAGLQPWQVNMLTEGYDGALFAKANELATSAEAQAADFEKLADGHFGEHKDAKLKIANDILKANVPDAFKDHIAGLDNKSLMMVSGVLNNVFDKYMKEDDLNIGGKGSATDATALQEEARTLMADPAYKDFRHPKHDAINKQVKDLYDQIGAIK